MFLIYHATLTYDYFIHESCCEIFLWRHWTYCFYGCINCIYACRMLTTRRRVHCLWRIPPRLCYNVSGRFQWSKVVTLSGSSETTRTESRDGSFPETKPQEQQLWSRTSSRQTSSGWAFSRCPWFLSCLRHEKKRDFFVMGWPIFLAYRWSILQRLCGGNLQ